MPSNIIPPHTSGSTDAAPSSVLGENDLQSIQDFLIHALQQIDRKLDHLEEVVTSSTEHENGVGASDLLDVKAVARRLNISVRTVESLIAEGQLKPLRIGRKRLFTSEAVETYLRSCAGRKPRMRSRRAA